MTWRTRSIYRESAQLAFAVLLGVVLLFAFANETGCRDRPVLDTDALQRHAFSHPQMGTEFNIVLYAPDSLSAAVAAAAAFDRIDTLNQRLSDYLVDSELNQLSATSGQGNWVRVSDDLWAVLSTAQELANQTNGAFDVTVGPLTVLWRWAVRRNQLPPADRLEIAIKAVGYRAIAMDSTSQQVSLRLPGMRLDLGGIAKGYAVDEALKELRSLGYTRVLVDGGGDIRVGDSPPGGGGWRIGMNASHELDPESRTFGALNSDRDGDWREHFDKGGESLTNVAVATSGSTYKFVDVEGTRYSHILDPRTGIGITGRKLVTVVAPTGVRADALASAISVLGIREGFELIREMDDVAVRIIDIGAHKSEVTETPSLPEVKRRRVR